MVVVSQNHSPGVDLDEQIDNKSEARSVDRASLIMVRPKGFEPLTFWSVGPRHLTSVDSDATPAKVIPLPTAPLTPLPDAPGSPDPQRKVA